MRKETDKYKQEGLICLRNLKRRLRKDLIFSQVEYKVLMCSYRHYIIQLIYLPGWLLFLFSAQQRPEDFNFHKCCCIWVSLQILVSIVSFLWELILVWDFSVKLWLGLILLWVFLFCIPSFRCYRNRRGYLFVCNIKKVPANLISFKMATTDLQS